MIFKVGDQILEVKNDDGHRACVMQWVSRGMCPPQKLGLF